MSDIGFDPGAISLDESGRVVLRDDQLAALADGFQLTLSGGNGQTNSDHCSNQASCYDTMNLQCSNTRGACDHSTNILCRTVDVDTIE